MSKITLNDVANLQNENTAVTTINGNNHTLQSAFDNTLSRDGTSPNQMEAVLDMNSHRIINLPTPATSTEPLRLVDANTLNGGGTISVSSLPIGGSLNQVLAKDSSTDFDVSWHTPSVAIPTGGSTGQVLTKNSAADSDATWYTPNYIPSGGTSGQTLVKNSSTDFDVSWGVGTTSLPSYNSVQDYTAANISFADGTYIRIQNYYATEPGGGHMCIISSTVPAHGAYHTSANGKYAVLAEKFPTFRMFGALPGGVIPDCTPYLDMWQDYCDASSYVATLDVETGHWVCITKPRPFCSVAVPWGRTIRGAGVQNCIFYTNYSTQDVFGFFHLLPNGNGGGLTLKDLQCISLKTDFTNGSAIAAHSGYVNYLNIGGTFTTGDVFSITIAGTTVNYTVIAGDNMASVLNNISSAINGNATIYNALNIAIPHKNKLVLISKISAPPSVTVSVTGSSSTFSVTNIGAQTTGYLYVAEFLSTSSNGWAYGLHLDGNRYDPSPGGGVRTSQFVNCTFFGAKYASIELRHVINASFSGCGTYAAGGAVGTIRLTGYNSNNKCQTINWSGQNAYAIDLDFALGCTFTIGETDVGFTNTANTDHCKIICAYNPSGVAQANWTNSAYL